MTALLCCLAVACTDDQIGYREAGTGIEPSSSQLAYAERAEPADGHLRELYVRSCQTCHARPGMGAPLTGHNQAWQARREARGMQGLLDATRSGRNAMPPMGLCPDCTEQDFHALIDFMSAAAVP